MLKRGYHILQAFSVPWRLTKVRHVLLALCVFPFPWASSKVFFPCWTHLSLSKAIVQCNVFGNGRLQRSLSIKNWQSHLFMLLLKNAYHGLKLLHLKPMPYSVSSVIASGRWSWKLQAISVFFSAFLLTAWNLSLSNLYRQHSPTVFSA